MVQGNQGISPQNMIGYGTVPTFLDPEILTDLGPWCLGVSHIFPNDASDDPAWAPVADRGTFQQGQQGMHQRLAQTHLPVTL